VTVLGLGNVLMRDDALGPFVIQTLLARYRFPERVSVQDLGTPGLELTPYLEHQDAVIVLDTVKADGPPGEVRLYRREALLRHPPAQRISPHDPGLKETILTLELHDAAPREVLVVGVVPELVDHGIGLTPAVRAAVPAVEAEVLRELDRLGCAAEPLAAPREPDIWWERR
jgi:hydrogenase maturation protease